MTKYSFLDDYSDGCHPSILEALQNTNLTQQVAYGQDEYSEKARGFIQNHLGGVQAPIFFVSGGTLANLIIISASLRSHEAVIAAHTAHIATHETGAIEAVGHKIISMQSPDGKLTPALVQQAVEENSLAPHMAKPRLVYISNTTETGRVYSKAELTALSTLCRENELLLMLDGARLGAAFASNKNDMSLEDIAALTDIFWIGGTKAGALVGEAIVISNPLLAPDFAFHIKQRGALLAKGRLLGLQFHELFKAGLFFRSADHANRLAQKISKAVVDNGYSLSNDTESNQIFPVLPNTLIERLAKDYAFYTWAPADENKSVIRIVTSWATDEKRVDALCRDLG